MVEASAEPEPKAAAPERMKSPNPPAHQLPISPSSIHVLLADDEKLSRLVVGNLLKRVGYRVTVVGNGVEALDAIRGSEPGTFQLLLTDVMMPDVDGIELLRLVREDARLADMPVVMMSANEHTDTVFECIRGGAEDYLLKPLTKKEVQYIWQHVWRRQHQHLAHPLAQQQQQAAGQEVAPAAAVPVQEPLQRHHSTPAAISTQAIAATAAAVAAAAQAEPPQAAQQQPAGAAAEQPGLAQAQRSAALDLRMRRVASDAAQLPLNRPAQLPRMWRLPQQPEGSARRDLNRAQLLQAVEASSPRLGAADGYGTAVLLRQHPADAADSSSSSPAAGQQQAQPQLSPSPAGLRLDAVRQQALPLSRYLARRSSHVAPRDLLKIFLATAATVQRAHARGRALLCVRPSLLQLTRGGQVLIARGRAASAEEEALYSSPEELLHGPVSPKADVYSLGVLLLELFHAMPDPAERARVLGDLRHRVLPVAVLQARPEQAAQLLLALVHPDPQQRPSVAEMLGSSLLAALRAALDGPAAQGVAAAAAARRQPAAAADAAAAGGRGDAGLLLEVLRHMQRSHAMEHVRVRQQLQQLDTDVGEVAGLLQHVAAQRSDQQQARRAAGQDAAPHQQPAQQRQGSKRSRQEAGLDAAPVAPSQQAPPGAAASEEDSLHAAKWQRICGALDDLQQAFFRRRGESLAGAGRGPAGAGQQPGIHGASPHLLGFLGDLEKFSRHSKLQVKATLRYSELLTPSDMVCSTAFDRDDEFFATAGVSRHIKVFDYNHVLSQQGGLQYPVLDIPSRSKLSSVCWNAYVKSHLICSDYEGVIQLWDAAAGVETAVFEEHAKRVWSVDFSQTEPTRFLSGSDDGSVRLWSMHDEAAVACIDTKANVCSVQFSPSDSNLMAFGSANYRVYLYDLRRIQAPLAVIGGHSKAVSYVRWLGSKALVSASTDNHLKLWDVDRATSTAGCAQPVMSYSGHVNEKNFVGLSVTPDGYIACGSETNAVHAYYQALPSPVCSHSFAAGQDAQGSSGVPDSHQFVSSVCWSRRRSTMIAANSVGTVKVLELA